MKLRVVIVDDEPLARDRVRSLLAKEPDVEVVGECGDGEQAVEVIRTLRPDLVFLDIQMPGADGFEVLRRLAPGPLPLVVFVTAFDQHAVRAFEARALDYLLKPFKQSRFRETLQRVRERRGAGASDDLPARLAALLDAQPARPPTLTRLVVRTGERTVLVPTAGIDFVEAAGNYAVVHVGRTTHIVRETMAALEEQLPPGFLRISRSTIVNLDRVRELQAMAAGEHVVVLADGRTLPMTRGLREVEERLKFS